MKKSTEFNSQHLRRERNSELLKRMRNGDPLASFNSSASWFPPRPIIQKDSDAIHELYGDEVVCMSSFQGDSHEASEHSTGLLPLRLA